mmetsp:Transcript_55425/g.110083  ORF Transcript_55425/g.110083 Transcript_55425/m.110083 type:complete len:117 (-) Transcript_55425:1946-2296(-)
MVMHAPVWSMACVPICTSLYGVSTLAPRVTTQRQSNALAHALAHALTHALTDVLTHARTGTRTRALGYPTPMAVRNGGPFMTAAAESAAKIKGLLSCRAWLWLLEEPIASINQSIN